MPDHGLVGRGDAADGRGEGRGAGPALRIRQCLEARADAAEGLRLAVLGDVRGGGVDDPQGVLLGLLRGVAPGGDAVSAEDAAHGIRVLPLDLGDIETELEAGAAPRHPHDLVAEDLRRQLRAVGGGRDGDAAVGVQVVDVRGIHEPVHGGVDRRRCAALSVQAVVEGGDHLVLAVDAGVDVHQRAHAIQAQYGQPLLGERAEVAAGALDPQQLDGLPCDRVGLGALGGRVASGVVGVLRVGAEPVRPGDEGGGSGGGHVGVLIRLWMAFESLKLRHFGAEWSHLSDSNQKRVGVQAPQPAWTPPTRSAAIRSRYPDAANAAIGSAGSPRDSRHSASAGRTSV